MSAVLGIDTSCYTTSCALADEDLSLLNAERMLLPVKEGMCGLRQSEAVFLHLKQLPQVLKSLMSGNDRHIAAVCVSSKPIDGEGSYMPVFQAGLSMAKSIAASLKVPCYETTHQRGHLAAAQIGCKPLKGDYAAMHLSGGTTDLLIVSGERLTRFSSSLDLPMGQLIDRVGVRLGLPFPAGPSLEQLAALGKAKGRYGVSIDDGGCHVSGAEAQAMRDIDRAAVSEEDIAAEVFDFISRTVLGMLNRVKEHSGIREALLFGGVASSELLRVMLTQRVKARRSDLDIRFGAPEYSGDNAAGVAIIGARRHFTHSKEGEHGKDT